MYFNAARKPTRQGNAHPSIVPYEVFKAADGYIALGVANNSLWERACGAMDRRDLTNDPRYATEGARVQHRATLIGGMNEILGGRTAEEWTKRFEAAGVPAGRIRTVAEVCESDHLKERGMILRLLHPKAGHVTMMGIPMRLQASAARPPTPPPTLGQHTDQVLRSLGYRSAALKRLHADGVV